MKSELDFLIEQINEYKSTISPIKGINYDILNKYIENARESFKVQKRVDTELTTETIQLSEGLTIKKAEKKKIFNTQKVFKLHDLPDYERLELLSSIGKTKDVYQYHICPSDVEPSLVSNWFLSQGCEHEENIIITII